MDKEAIKENARAVMVNPRTDVLSGFEDFFDEFSLMLATLSDINTDDIEPMTRINNHPVTTMRSDALINNNISKDDLIANAPCHDKDFILTRKRTNNDD